MKPSLDNVEKLLTQLKDKTCRAKKTAPSKSSPDIGSFIHQVMYQLSRCAPVYLNETSALDSLLTAAPEFESYRGKGTQTINDGYPRILQSILMEIEFGLLSSDDPPVEYPEETVSVALKKIAQFALDRAKGDGKHIRSKRAANIRQSYWEVITDMLDHYSLPETLTSAKKVVPDAKASIPERQGALSYLLTFLSFANDQQEQDCDYEKSKVEIKSIINAVRENPPSRDILFQILDAEVDAGEIGEMTALIDLEDWDEKNAS